MGWSLQYNFILQLCNIHLLKLFVLSLVRDSRQSEFPPVVEVNFCAFIYERLILVPFGLTVLHFSIFLAAVVCHQQFVLAAAFREFLNFGEAFTSFGLVTHYLRDKYFFFDYSQSSIVGISCKLNVTQIMNRNTNITFC